MSEILSFIVDNLLTIISTFGIGIESVLFYKQTKKLKDSETKLKEAEVKAAEVDVKSAEIKNLSASNEEWIKINANLSTSKERLEKQLVYSVEKLDEAHKSKEAAWERYSNCRAECSKKDLVISELNWYRCEVNGCPYRKPPRKYGDMDFPKDSVNPVENPDPNIL